MYPHGELELLLARKTALRRRIADSRIECTMHAAGVLRPLLWIDQAVAIWRQMQPFVRLAAVPLGFWVMRSFSRRFRLLGSLLRWGPLLFNVIRGFTRPATESASARSGA